jgi:glycosyltransferase involved in cell wall biosynthesis
MYKGKKIAVVVPAYNEERLIGKTLRSMPEYIDLIVTVNDGSTDNTAALIEQHRERDPRIYPINNDPNLGLGLSIWKGYAKCDEEGADVFVVMAGDGQMAPEDLPNLLDPIIEGEVEYSKGNRLQNKDVKEHMPLYRFFGNAILTVLTKFATGYWHAVDPQCGYTTIKREAYQAVDKEKIHQGYGYNADILIRLNIANCRLAEVPVKAIYGEAKSGIKLYKYIPNVSLLLVKLFVKRLANKYLWAFHPILLYYIFGIILLLGGGGFGSYVLLIDLLTLREIGYGWMLLGSITILTGIQSIFFAIWLDMQDNQKLNANDHLFCKNS